MQEHPRPVSRVALWAFWLYTLLLVLFGATMLVLGAMLAFEGGSATEA